MKSSMNHVADKIVLVARRATKVVAGTTMPRSTTQRARDFAATHTGTGFTGGLPRYARCEGKRPFAASRALHSNPHNPVRGHVGLNQGFLKSISIKQMCLAWLVVLALLPYAALAERIKDVASIQGVRDNQLIGYGIVVGLDGSGDQTTQTPFTVQSVISMLSQMGVNLPQGTGLQLKNVAAVVVTATLPPFSKPGQTIDVTTSSIGNAKSLRGGTLLMSPLKGADGQVYAIAQGNVLVGGVGAASGGASTQVNHLSVGRVPSGATVERAVPTILGQGDFINLELNQMDFTTAARIVEVINVEIAPDIAVALDGRMIQVRAPAGNGRVAFISRIENLEVDPAPGIARVIINARTGSVVMNQLVTLQPCAVAHGNLTVVINSDSSVSQPNALSKGQTRQTDKTTIEVKADKGGLVQLNKGVSLSEVVKALNSMGATPQDLLAILQAMKSAGALRAELEII